MRLLDRITRFSDSTISKKKYKKHSKKQYKSQNKKEFLTKDELVK